MEEKTLSFGNLRFCLVFTENHVRFWKRCIGFIKLSLNITENSGKVGTKCWRNFSYYLSVSNQIPSKNSLKSSEILRNFLKSLKIFENP